MKIIEVSFVEINCINLFVVSYQQDSKQLGMYKKPNVCLTKNAIFPTVRSMYIYLRYVAIPYIMVRDK